MYIAYKISIRLIPLTHRLCWLTDECRIRRLVDWNSDGLSACRQWRNGQCRMSPHEFQFVHTNIWSPIYGRQYMVANRTLPPFLVFVCRNPRHHFAEPWSSVETRFRNSGLDERWCKNCLDWIFHGLSTQCFKQPVDWSLSFHVIHYHTNTFSVMYNLYSRLSVVK